MMTTIKANFAKSDTFKTATSNHRRFKRALAILVIAVHYLSFAILTAVIFSSRSIVRDFIIIDGILFVSILFQLMSTLMCFEALDEPEVRSSYIKLMAVISTLTMAVVFWSLNVVHDVASAILTVARPILIPIFTGIVVLAVIAIIYVIITKAIKWIVWNGYSSNFIGITLRTNIKRFNSIDSIGEKLPATANLEDVANALTKHHDTIKTVQNKRFWW